MTEMKPTIWICEKCGALEGTIDNLGNNTVARYSCGDFVCRKCGTIIEKAKCNYEKLKNLNSEQLAKFISLIIPSSHPNITGLLNMAINSRYTEYNPDPSEITKWLDSIDPDDDLKDIRDENAR